MLLRFQPGLPTAALSPEQPLAGQGDGVPVPALRAAPRPGLWAQTPPGSPSTRLLPEGTAGPPRDSGQTPKP